MPARLEFDVRLGRPRAPQRRPEGSPMRLLLLGDFSGRGPRGAGEAATLPQRSVHRVDLDTLQQVFARIAPRVPLLADPAEPAALLEFESLDDFHPDRLYERVAIFASLRALRERLLDPARFDLAADELRAHGLASPEAGGGVPAVSAAKPENDSSTLQRLLGSAPAASSKSLPPRAAGAIDALIRRLAAPYIVPSNAPQQPVYLAAVDAAIGGQMRRLLHNPAFSAVESAWRGVQWLVSRLELNEDLQLYLYDATREELQADLIAAQGDPARSGLYRALCPPGPDEGTHWSLLAGLFSIGPGADDLGLLAALGTLTSQAGGPVVAAAAPALFGCGSVDDLSDPLRWQPLADEDAQRWSLLRRSAVAPWLGLVAPRVLLRLPYGKHTDATERFEFEEQPAPPEHETLLWGPGSLAVAMLVGQAFTDGGWDFAAEAVRNLEDLPAYTFRRDGAAHLQPCGEAWLGERAGEALLGCGLMPLLSHRQSATVRLMRMQSVADPAQLLAGPWT